MHAVLQKRIHSWQDEGIKNLIRDYPTEALHFFKPEILARYGQPINHTFVIQESKKHSHFDSTLRHDLAVIYDFAYGPHAVLALMEHWSDKNKFDIHRFAHYIIDLDKQYPNYEKIPIAIFTDQSASWKTPLRDTLEIMCMGEVYLSFRYCRIRLKDYEAAEYRTTDNPFVAVMRSHMHFTKI